MERIGRYQIERELGRGAMSIVYEAFDPHINRNLAVKVLKERYARDVRSRQRFLREARSAGGLNHPNIVTIYDVGQAEGVPYMVMERLHGESLEEYLVAGKTPSVREITEIGIQLAGALHYAHEHGVIHRDIKPSNIYFDHEANLIKLLDFGIAAVEDRMREHQGDDNQVLAGTPRYMAPEQVLGNEIDGRTDLYALGVVLFELLAGRLPFTAESMGELAQQIVHQPPPPLEPLDENTPVELTELVLQLLAKHPETRHASGVQVLEELQEIRADTERGLLRSARAHSPGWRWPLVFSASLALILGAGLVWVYHSQTEAMTEATHGYGDALASVVARETAEGLLLEDTTALNTLVSDFSVNPRIVHLHITDREGVVQASTDPFLQGEALPETGGRMIERPETSTRLFALDDDNLEFQVPIRFQARRMGRVHLGIDGSELQAAASTTLWMLVVVFLVSVIAVAAGFVWLWRWQLRSVQRIGWGLQRIARGQYDFRLDSNRQDTLATLYQRFNDMAHRLEERHGFETPQAPAPEVERGDPDASGGNLESTVVIDDKDEDGEKKS